MFFRAHVGIFIESMLAILELRTCSHFGTISIYRAKNYMVTWPLPCSFFEKFSGVMWEFSLEACLQN